jgi:hypothetical protein
MWFKLTLSKEGAIESCEEVPAFDKSGREVRFVEAESEAGARAIVLAWQREQAQLKVRRKRTYDAVKASGFCAFCKKVPRLEGKVSCEGCTEKHRQYARDRYHGRIKPREVAPDAERVSNFEKKRAERIALQTERHGSSYGFAKKVARRDVLAEVRVQFESLTVTAFRSWLIDEHEKAVAERPPSKQAEWRRAAAESEPESFIEGVEGGEPGDDEQAMREGIERALSSPRRPPDRAAAARSQKVA